eukprot:m.119085 g.119085  ORF g.119085 m.119085 type:complete len:273 (-) comp23160_c0_seq5:77-895(-)
MSILNLKNGWKDTNPCPEGSKAKLPFPSETFEQLFDMGNALLHGMEKEAFSKSADRPWADGDVPGFANPPKFSGDAGPWHLQSHRPDGFKLLRRKMGKGKPDLAGGVGVFGFPIDVVVHETVARMQDNCPKWDTVCSGINVIEKWSDQDFCYQYQINPFMISRRDMVYYEGWRKHEETGVVICASCSVPELEAKVPVPAKHTRMRILLHFKRYTPLPNNKTRYETLQQIEIGGWVSNSMSFSGVLDGLHKEFAGFTEIMADLEQKKESEGKQ